MRRFAPSLPYLKSLCFLNRDLSLLFAISLSIFYSFYYTHHYCIIPPVLQFVAFDLVASFHLCCCLATAITIQAYRVLQPFEYVATCSHLSLLHRVTIWVACYNHTFALTFLFQPFIPYFIWRNFKPQNCFKLYCSLPMKCT